MCITAEHHEHKKHMVHICAFQQNTMNIRNLNDLYGIETGVKCVNSSSSQYNIQAYPTTVVFNQSSIHEYEGHHSAEQILEFIEVFSPRDFG